MLRPLISLGLLLVVALWSAPAGAGMDKKASGNGLYGHLWRPDAVQEYWDPETFQRPETEFVEGRFTTAECLECHASVTPGIVKDWQRSRHAAPRQGAGLGPAVACDGCHGSDHQALRFPSPADCGACHQRQHGQFLAERRYGFPSHALAMTRAVNTKHFVDKPKAEVTACLQCHSVATKCDSCHTRHRFSAAEARRPEACLTCHSGPPHPDDESYLASAHGQRYLAEGASWDWSKPLRKGNYPVPTCAYCHLRNGNHQVADKAIWKFGLRQRNPRTAENQVKRRRWLAVCADCHERPDAAAWLQGLDAERKAAWKLLYRAEDELRALRSGDLIQPLPGQRPPYPLDWWESFWPRLRIGFYEGQASAFYNVSAIERDYFEMWYFDGLGSYKAAAHGDDKGVREGHQRLRHSLQGITQRARELQVLGAREEAAGATFDPGRLWLDGPYTDLNREQN